MNVARGTNVFSLLQRGVGTRAGYGGSLSTRDFLGGFHLVERDNEGKSTRPWGQTNMSCRPLSTRVRRGYKKVGTAKPPTTPTMDEALSMPRSCSEMNNSDLVMLGAMGVSDARKEILIRHIMTVDKVPYETACETFTEIAEKNREGMWILTLPYKIGISVAVTAAVCSFPLVFDINTVSWFNEYYVTADVPEPKDLETPLEVGSWAWNWMEPPLGQISFVLLCMQYTRAQIANIGIRPYTEKVMASRANSLAAAFPQYDPQIVKDFSLSISFYDEHHGIKFGDPLRK